MLRLMFNPVNEIHFQKQPDQTMRGNVEIKNASTDTIFAFKVKCTNPDLFNVTPLKGTIYSNTQILIEFNTNDPVNMDFAKELATKHKFLIEYVPIASENSLANFKNHEAQRKKLYINMDSLRGGANKMSKFRDQDKLSMNSAISNKMSYISMKNQKPSGRMQTPSALALPTPHKSFFNNNSQAPQRQQISSSKQFPATGQQLLQQRYSSLKDELDDLNRERQEVMNKMSRNRKLGGGGFGLKKLLVLVIFIVLGGFMGSYAKQQVRRRQQEEAMRKMQEQSAFNQLKNGEGWFDFSNWFNFDFLDIFYDEVQPDQIIKQI